MEAPLTPLAITGALVATRAVVGAFVSAETAGASLPAIGTTGGANVGLFELDRSHVLVLHRYSNQ